MKILMNTARTNEYGEGCEYAVVDVTVDLAKAVLGRRKVFLAAKAADADAYELYFWHYQVRYYCNGNPYGLYDEDESPELDEDALPAAVREALDSRWWVVLPEDFALPENEERTECDQMIIRETGVSWTCIPKHASFYVITKELPYSIFGGLL